MRQELSTDIFETSVQITGSHTLRPVHHGKRFMSKQDCSCKTLWSFKQRRWKLIVLNLCNHLVDTTASFLTDTKPPHHGGQFQREISIRSQMKNRDPLKTWARRKKSSDRCLHKKPPDQKNHPDTTLPEPTPAKPLNAPSEVVTSYFSSICFKTLFPERYITMRGIFS